MNVPAVSPSPRVAVVMPAFNAASFIGEAIASVREQTFADWELLVVDDGSTDGTASVVAEWSARDARIRLLQQPNGGQGNARNNAIRATSAPWIAFLDADDLWESEKLASQWKALEEQPSDVIFSDGHIFSEGKAAPPATFGTLRGMWSGEGFLPMSLEINRVPILSALISKAAIEEVGGFDERREVQTCEDYDLWLRLARSGASFQGMPDVLVRYRRHSGAMTVGSHAIAPLRAEIEVLRPFINQAPPLAAIARARLRQLHWRIAFSLVAQGKSGAAREEMRSPQTCEVSTPVVRLQRLIFAGWPRGYSLVHRALTRLRRVGGALRRKIVA